MVVDPLGTVVARAGNGAEVLTADVDDTQGAWDVIDCLQLWNARGWVLEDSPAGTRWKVATKKD